MATLAIYGSHHPGFIDNSAHMTSQSVTPAIPPNDETEMTSFWCRALYDYQANDASSLSFHKDDIIEVLTQLPSGWWDGLLGDERGWFPSNYVIVISDEEADTALGGSDVSLQPYTTDSTLTQSQRGIPELDRQWLEDGYDNGASQNGLIELANATMDAPSQSSDFWMPQVTPDGQIYYVNTKTGEHARDIPHEVDDEVSDGDLAGLTSQSSSRSGTSAGLGLGASDRSGSCHDLGDPTGFGLLKRNGTPEPWVKKLADDGMSYYYLNRLNGQIEWTRPEPTTTIHTREQVGSESVTLQSVLGQAPLVPNRLNVGDSAPDAQALNQRTGRHQGELLVNLDSQYLDPGPSMRMPFTNGDLGVDIAHARQVRNAHGDRFVVNLTSAERLAQSLQHALTPSPPEQVSDMSDALRKDLAAILDYIQSPIFARRTEDESIEGLVDAVVLGVRNLLYISAAPTHIPGNVFAQESRDLRDHSASQALLKPAQRKVTATLSKLVLSARAMQYESGSSTTDSQNRIEGAAEDLERAIIAYVLAVERCRNQEHMELERAGPKRLRGIFGTANVGLGLVGAGAAASWKGFGWVALDDYEQSPKTVMGTEVLGELASILSQVEHQLDTLIQVSQNPGATTLSGGIAAEGQLAVTQLSSFLTTLSNIYVARHVDIDGVSQDAGHHPPENEGYAQTVTNARSLVRTLEAAAQSLYNDCAALFISFQSIRRDESNPPQRVRTDVHDQLEALASALKANVRLVHQTLEALLAIGHQQADLSQGDYTGSIERRMSRLSMIHTQFGGVLRPASKFSDKPYEEDNEDVVDIAHALRRVGSKSQDGGGTLRNLNATYQSSSQLSEASIDTFMTTSAADTTWIASESSKSTVVDSTESPPDEDLNAEFDPGILLDDDLLLAPLARPGTRRGNKPLEILGEDLPQHYQDIVNADLKPWYLRPNYSPTDIIIEYPEGSVKGGTVPALVERLTAHEHGDPAFIKTFLMTYKSFTTLNELFDLLVQRFWIQAPPNLTPSELAEWKKLKQHIIQMRVLNTFKSMVVDDDVLEKEDMYILDRMKEFISNQEVIKLAAAKQLMIFIERAQRGGDAIKMIGTAHQTPPPPIMPKTSKKLKLLDVDPLELARQLTLLESQLYQKIRPIECLQRAREQKTEHNDNIAAVIQTSNRIADWVAESILSKEDVRRRAATIKHFIQVADRCRALHNYSSMVAITSGLNTPPIHRLKRTWEQVNARFMSLLSACEMTIDSNKNFNNYRLALASVTPPCVPFIGVFLTTLQFIQDGSKDNLSPNMVNFRKRQKASEVIQDIKRWQSQPFAFHQIPSVRSFIDESLNQFNDASDIRDRFWNLSLEREPREREDEKMARLLQESGFL